ncbi:hypothetical protein DPMN_121031 [Dreissena polymorpha]|uniref:Uncharacterized protein n=1 Tax=Dreissena polymorpha TaxID=45954 RepID=A0A9D4GM07_DREPO|nr:hypothetical protein DPMN_121031 [Dreissena polymorpha]
MPTMENKKYVAIGPGQLIEVPGEINAVIELGEYLLTSNKTTNTLVLYNMSLKEITRHVFERAETGRSRTVKDIAKISSSSFAVLVSDWCDMWIFDSCQLWILELDDDLRRFRLVKQIAVAMSSSSICYQRDFIFTAVTPFIGESYIQQIPIDWVKHREKRDYKHILFRKSIQILDVYPDFVMYVCDKKQKLLYIFGKDTFSDSLMISDKTTHRYRVMDIAKSDGGATYMATDSSDGVVLLSENREWTFNNFLPKSKLGGTPDCSYVY